MGTDLQMPLQGSDLCNRHFGSSADQQLGRKRRIRGAKPAPRHDCAFRRQSQSRSGAGEGRMARASERRRRFE